jgi:Transcription-repair coupling factor (superfamily II helicase)
VATNGKKLKRKVQSNIEDIADDLIDLYAKREAEKGFAFPKDDQMQHDFDNAFPYPETPDQLRSVDEIKRDMEKPHPMDRLLLGMLVLVKRKLLYGQLLKRSKQVNKWSF